MITLYSGDTPPDGLAELLLAAFAEPPYRYDRARVERQVGRWPVLASIPGFSCLTAHQDGTLVGVTWGWPTTSLELPGGLFASLYAEIATCVDPAELAGRYEIVELAVHPAVRGGGLGRKLLAELVAGRPSWLLAHPDAAAGAWYERMGWVPRADVASLRLMTRD